MKRLKEKMNGLFDIASAQANSLFSEFNSLVNSFEVDENFASMLNEKKNALIEKSNKVLGDFSELIKQVKETLDDFTVTVPFDGEKGEEYEITRDGNSVVIKVTYKDDNMQKESSTKVLIPQGCDYDRHSVSKNKLMKTLTLTIPKETSDENVAEGGRGIFSKLEEKLKQNEDKFAKMMGDNGIRFVRRNPNNQG